MSSLESRFLSKFYEPKVTAYEFLKCFFAFLKKENVREIDRDLSSFLQSQKGIPENCEVLEEINFRSNGVNYYSDDIENALFNLQNGGLLGKMNYPFNNMIIKYTDEEAEKAINLIPEQYRLTIRNMVRQYLT